MLEFSIIYLHFHLNSSPIHFNPTVFITSYCVKSFYAFHLSILIKNKRIFMIIHVNIRFHERESRVLVSCPSKPIPTCRY